MNTITLISEVVSLPIEERALVAELLLQSLNQPESKVDFQWGVVAQKRLDALQKREVVPIDGKPVFNKIWKQFEK